MIDEIDEDEEGAEEFVVDLSDPMYNIENVKNYIKQTRNRRKVELVFEDPENDFNLFKFFLALERYYEGMKNEIGIMAASGEGH